MEITDEFIKDFMSNYYFDFTNVEYEEMAQRFSLFAKIIIHNFWIPVSNPPKLHDINEDCAEYYLVKIKGYGAKLAMYLIDDDGITGWYTNYTSKIFRHVIHYAIIPK